MSDQIDDWIAEALETSPTTCAEPAAAQIRSRAMEVFVRGKPRVWWLALLHHVKSTPSASVPITAIMPAREGWLIPEGSLKVYAVTGEQMETIRRRSPPFEYNLVSKTLDWMISESDHDEFHISAVTPGVHSKLD